MGEDSKKEWWQRWIETYWKNRLDGVPVTLDDGEVQIMMDWLPHMGTLFPDAVELATQAPKSPLEHGSVVYELSKCDLLQRFPEDVAKLLIYLGETGTPAYIFHQGREIIDELLKQALPTNLEEGLKELIAKLGL